MLEAADIDTPRIAAGGAFAAVAATLLRFDGIYSHLFQLLRRHLFQLAWSLTYL